MRRHSEQNTVNRGTKINNKWDFMKLKHFYNAKDIIIRTKWQFTE